MTLKRVCILKKFENHCSLSKVLYTNFTKAHNFKCILNWHLANWIRNYLSFMMFTRTNHCVTSWATLIWFAHSHPYFLKAHWNIIFPPMSESPKRSEVHRGWKGSNPNTVGSRFATVNFTAIHFYDPCPVRPSTPELWCIPDPTQVSFLYLLHF